MKCPDCGKDYPEDSDDAAFASEAGVCLNCFLGLSGSHGNDYKKCSGGCSK